MTWMSEGGGLLTARDLTMAKQTALARIALVLSEFDPYTEI
jgi:hypothetical protein